MPSFIILHTAIIDTYVCIIDGFNIPPETCAFRYVSARFSFNMPPLVLPSPRHAVLQRRTGTNKKREGTLKLIIVLNVGIGVFQWSCIFPENVASASSSLGGWRDI
jgi:hypothetical protein